MSKLAFLQGAPSEEIQLLLKSFGERLLQGGTAVAGMVEIPTPVAEDQDTLLDLVSRRQLRIYQDLGKFSQSCSLDAVGLSEAAGLLEAQMHSGTQLVIASKFGKAEAEGFGFCNVFRKALLLDIPVLTSVNPNFHQPWLDFSGGLAMHVTPTPQAISDWWACVKGLD